MKRRVLAPSLALILLLTGASTAPAQWNAASQTATGAGAQDWQGLRDLKPGKKLLVETRIGVVEGKFVGLTGSRLTMSDDGYVFSFEQRDILRIYRSKSWWSRSKGARIGAIVFGGIGLVIGTAQVVSSPDPENPWAVGGLTLGILSGAGLGALLGGRRKGRLLYEAK